MGRSWRKLEESFCFLDPSKIEGSTISCHGLRDAESKSRGWFSCAEVQRDGKQEGVFWIGQGIYLRESARCTVGKMHFPTVRKFMGFGQCDDRSARPTTKLRAVTLFLAFNPQPSLSPSRPSRFLSSRPFNYFWLRVCVSASHTIPVCHVSQFSICWQIGMVELRTTVEINRNFDCWIMVPCILEYFYVFYT